MISSAMHQKAVPFLPLAIVGIASTLAFPPMGQSGDKRELRSRNGTFLIVLAESHGGQSIPIGSTVKIDASLLSRLLVSRGRTI